MSRKYTFYGKDDLYFVIYTVVNWIDVFTRNEYRKVLLDSWQYCMKEKRKRTCHLCTGNYDQSCTYDNFEQQRRIK